MCCGNWVDNSEIRCFLPPLWRRLKFILFPRQKKSKSWLGMGALKIDGVDFFALLEYHTESKLCTSRFQKRRGYANRCGNPSTLTCSRQICFRATLLLYGCAIPVAVETSPRWTLLWSGLQQASNRTHQLLTVSAWQLRGELAIAWDKHTAFFKLCKIELFTKICISFVESSGGLLHFYNSYNH